MLHQEIDIEKAREFLHQKLEQYPSNDKGLFYVELFVLACLKMKAGGEIEGVEVYQKHSAEDRSGVDAAIQVRGQRILFQITSTSSQVDEHRGVHKKNPDRPPVHFLPLRKGDLPLLKTERKITREIRQRIKKGKYR